MLEKFCAVFCPQTFGSQDTPPSPAPKHVCLSVLPLVSSVQVLGSVSMKRPNYALYSNVTAKPYQTVDEMKTLLVEQVVSGVRWEETVMVCG